MTRKLQQLWARKGRISVWDIGFGHFVARFDSEEDYLRALLEGPWLVGDHYVLSEEWRPNFEPGVSQVNSVRVWIRLPGIPLENFDMGILKLIGDRIGKTIRVDSTTLFGSRGNYARLCVEVDLHKPLVSKYRLHRRVRRVEYEGLHEICFECGRYGHVKDHCPSLRESVAEPTPAPEAIFENPLFQATEERPEVVDDYGPWMKAKKNMRRRKKSTEIVQTPKPESTKKQQPDGSRFSTLGDLEVSVPQGDEVNPEAVEQTTEEGVDEEIEAEAPPAAEVQKREPLADHGQKASAVASLQASDEVIKCTSIPSGITQSPAVGKGKEVGQASRALPSSGVELPKPVRPKTTLQSQKSEKLKLSGNSKDPQKEPQRGRKHGGDKARSQ
ncbi:hypothetical protein LINPERHAP2_LOCUS24598 [Linum perenne]